ncbi:hypothetical protein GBA52_015253 [Prunus armeniaca]|nr:hypothetical protein GBA52_015253 [Prunus armeniaca]
MTLHNYIRRHAQGDKHFDNPCNILSEEIDRDVDVQQHNHTTYDQGGQEMEALSNNKCIL